MKNCEETKKDGQNKRLFCVFSVISAMFCAAVCGLLFTQCSDADSVGMGESVDSQAPTLSITYPPVGCAPIMEDFILAGTATDDKGIKALTLEIEKTSDDPLFEAAHPGSVIQKSISIHDNWSIHLNELDANGKRELTDGTYHITVTAKDDVPHIVTQQKDITIDNTPPVLVLTSPSTFGNSKTPATLGQEIKISGDFADSSDTKLATLILSTYNMASPATPVTTLTYKDVPINPDASYILAKYYQTQPQDKDKLRQYNNYKALMGMQEGDEFPSIAQLKDDKALKEQYTRRQFLSMEFYDSAKCYKDPLNLQGAASTTKDPNNTITGNWTNRYYLKATKEFQADSSLQAQDIMKMQSGLWTETDAEANAKHEVTIQKSISPDIKTGESLAAQSAGVFDMLPTIKFCYANSPTYTISKWALNFDETGTPKANTGEYVNSVMGSAASSVWVTFDASVDKAVVKYDDEDDTNDGTPQAKDAVIYLKEAEIQNSELESLAGDKTALVEKLDEIFDGKEGVPARGVETEGSRKYIKNGYGPANNHTDIPNSPDKGVEYQYTFTDTALKQGLYYKVYVEGVDINDNAIEPYDNYFVIGKSNSEKPTIIFFDGTSGHPTFENKTDGAIVAAKELEAAGGGILYTGTLTLSEALEDAKAAQKAYPPITIYVNGQKAQGSVAPTSDDPNIYKGVFSYSTTQTGQTVEDNITVDFSMDINPGKYEWEAKVKGAVAQETTPKYNFKIELQDGIGQAGSCSRAIGVDNKRPIIEKTPITKVNKEGNFFVTAEDLIKETSGPIYRFEGTWSDDGEKGVGADKIYYTFDKNIIAQAGTQGWTQVENAGNAKDISNWKCKISSDTLKGVGKNIYFKAIDKGGLESEVLKYENIVFDYDSPKIAISAFSNTDNNTSCYYTSHNATRDVASVTISDDVKIQEPVVEVYKGSLTTTDDGMLSIDDTTKTLVASTTPGASITDCGISITLDSTTTSNNTDTKKVYNIKGGSQDGVYVIKATSADCALQEGAKQSVAFTIDTVAPVLQNMALEEKPYLSATDASGVVTKGFEDANNDLWLKSTTLGLKGSFTESGSGIEKLYYKLTTRAKDETTGTLLAPATKEASLPLAAGSGIDTVVPNFQVAIANGAQGSEQNILELWVKDKAGNESDRQKYYVNIDQKPPTLTNKKEEPKMLVNRTKMTAGNNKDFSGYWSDDASGVKAITLTSKKPAGDYVVLKAPSGVDTTTQETVTEGGVSVTKNVWKSTLTANDLAVLDVTGGQTTFEIFATATDKAGNSSDVKLFTLEIDETNPTVEITGITPIVKTDGGAGSPSIENLNGTVTVSGKANDTNLDYVMLKVYKGTDNTGDVLYEKKIENAPFSWSEKIDTVAGTFATAGTSGALYDKNDIFVEAVAFDKAGNSGDIPENDAQGGAKVTTNKKYKLDQSTDHPVISPSNFAKGGYWDDALDKATGNNKFGSKTNNKLIASVTDDDGIQKIQISTGVDANGAPVWNDYTDFTAGTTSAGISYALPGVCGSYDIQIKVEDTTYDTTSASYNGFRTTTRGNKLQDDGATADSNDWYKVAVDDSSPLFDIAGSSDVQYIGLNDNTSTGGSDYTKVILPITLKDDWRVKKFNLFVFGKDDDVTTTPPKKTIPITLDAGSYATVTGTGSTAVYAAKNYEITRDTIANNTTPEGQGTIDGVYKLRFVAVDNVGQEATLERLICVDETVPEFGKGSESASNKTDIRPYITTGGTKVTDNATPPVTKTWYKDASLEIKGTVKESGSGISSIKYNIPSLVAGAPSPQAQGDFAAAGSFTSTISALKTGNTINLTVTDKAGNKSDTSISDINIDQTGPSVVPSAYTINGKQENVSVTMGADSDAQTSPVLSNGAQDLVVHIKAKDTADGSGLKKVEIATGGGSDFSSAITLNKGDAGASWGTQTDDAYECVLKIPANVGGQAKTIDNGQVACRLTDEAGNQTLTSLFVIDLDDMEPTATIKEPRPSAKINKKIQVSGTANDNKGLKEVKLYVSKKLTSNTEAVPQTDADWTQVPIYQDTIGAASVGANDYYNWAKTKTNGATATPDNRWDTTSIQDGFYYLKAVVFDKAGNTTDPTAAGEDLIQIEVDINSDRPIAKITNLNDMNKDASGAYLTGQKRMLRNSEKSHIEGTVSDDDATTTETLQKFIVSSEPIDAASLSSIQGIGGSLETSGEFIGYTKYEVPHTVKGATVNDITYFNKKSSDWRFFPYDGEDGAKNMYFYALDTEGGEFYTGQASAKDRLFVQFKTDAKMDNNDVIAYTADSNSPVINFGKMIAGSDKDATTNAIIDNANKVEGLGISDGTVVGGSLRQYSQFVISAQDNNDIKGMTLSITGVNKTKTPPAQETLTFATSATTLGDVTYTASDVSGSMKKDDALSGAGATPNDGYVEVWTTDALDLSIFETGTIDVKVAAFDGSDIKSSQTYAFRLDNSGPTIKITSPSGADENTGALTITGTAMDVGSLSSSDVAQVMCIIPKVGHRAANVSDTSKDATLIGLPKRDIRGEYGWFDTNTQSTATFFKFPFDARDTVLLDIYTKYDTAKTYHNDADINGAVYSVPIYFYAIDNLGNITIDKSYKIRYNPDGDMPQTTLSYPTVADYDKDNNTGASLGHITLSGNIRMTGSCIIPIGGDVNVDSVYFQIAPAGGADGKSVDETKFAKNALNAGKQWAEDLADAAQSATKVYQVLDSPALPDAVQSLTWYGTTPTNTQADWWGIRAKGTTSWAQMLNARSELDPPATATGVASINYVQVRACGVNSNGKVGQWSTPVVMWVDNTAPQAAAQLMQYENDLAASGSGIDNPEAGLVAAKEYVADMYIKGSWYLLVQLTDESSLIGGSINIKKGSLPLKKDTDYFVSEQIGTATSAGNFLLPAGKNAKVGRYIYIKTNPNDAYVSYTVSAMDTEPTGHNLTRTYDLNIDNKAPVTGQLQDAQARDLDASEIKNSNYATNICATTTDEGSGYALSAVFFKRDRSTQQGGQADTIEVPFLDATGKPFVNANAVSTTIKDNTQFTGLTKYTYKDSVTGKAIDTGLWGVGLTGTRGATDQITVSSLTNYKFIKTGSCVIVGGTPFVIKSIQGDTVTFKTVKDEEANVPLSITKAFFACAMVVDGNTKGESGKWKGGALSVVNDDADGFVETIAKSGRSWAWEVDPYTATLDDGPVELCCVTFDIAGNHTLKTADVMISNKVPRLSKVWAATDLTGDGKFEDCELGSSKVAGDGAVTIEKYYSALDAGSVQQVVTLNQDYKKQDADTGLRLSESLLLSLEFVNDTDKNGQSLTDEYEGYGRGSGNLKYSARAVSLSNKDTVMQVQNVTQGDLNALKQGTTNVLYEDAASVTDEAAKRGVVTGGRVGWPYIMVSNATSGVANTNKTSGIPQGTTECNTNTEELSYLSFTIWDESVGTTAGTAGVIERSDKKRDYYTRDAQGKVQFGSHWTILNVPLKVDLVDDTPPLATITPFYWEGAKDTGNIEEFTPESIKVRYPLMTEEQRAAIIKHESQNNSLYYADIMSGTKVIKENAVMGHIELGEDLLQKDAQGKPQGTPIPAVSGIVKLEGKAFDEHRLKSLAFSIPKASGTLSSTINYSNGTWDKTGDLATDGYEFSVTESSYEQSGNSAYWKLILDTAKLGNGTNAQKYLTVTATQEQGADSDTFKKSTPGVTQTIVAAQESDIKMGTTGYYKMDIVPYITNVARNTPTYMQGQQRRSRTGRYPLVEGESVKVEGFNFASDIAATVDSLGASSPRSASIVANSFKAGNSKDYDSFTLTVPNRSGYLQVTSVTKSKNNDNNNVSYGTFRVNKKRLDKFDQRQNCYNREVSEADEELTLDYTDDRYLSVWNLGNYFNKTAGGAEVQNPVMAASKEGNLYASWVAPSNANVIFSYGVKEHTSAIFRCYDTPSTAQDLAVDTKGTQTQASVAFIPEHQGSGGTFSRTGFASNMIVGGAGAINLNTSFLTAKPQLQGLEVQVRGNPGYKIDGENYTAYYSLASYDMNRRMGSFENPRAARYGNILHNIWYDNVTNALKYSAVDVGGTTGDMAGDLLKFTGFSGSGGNPSYTSDGNQIRNGNGAAIAGWVVIDGGYTGQDRVYDWAPAPKSRIDASNFLMSKPRIHTYYEKVSQNTDGEDENAGSMFREVAFASSDLLRKESDADTAGDHPARNEKLNGGQTLLLEGLTATDNQAWNDRGKYDGIKKDNFSTTSVTYKRVTKANEYQGVPIIGGTIALMDNATGAFKLSLRTITGYTIKNDNGSQTESSFKSDNGTQQITLSWSGGEPVTHRITSIAIYTGAMNIVGNTVGTSNINSVAFDSGNHNAQTAGTSADIDVDATGKPVVAYNADGKLRVAYSNSSDLGSKVASVWTRVATSIKCLGDVSCRVDGAGGIHITFKGDNNRPCYVYAGSTSALSSLKESDTEVIDTIGTLTQSSLSLRKTGSLYTPYVSYLNEAGTINCIKFAQRRYSPQDTTNGKATNSKAPDGETMWDYQIAPSLGGARVAQDGNKTSIAANYNWSATTDILVNGGDTDVTPKTAEAAVAFHSDRFDVEYLKTE